LPTLIALHGGFQSDGTLEVATRGACDKAIEMARKLDAPVMFVIGHGERVRGLHNATRAYLADRGLPSGQLILRPVADSTITEVAAMTEELVGNGADEVIVVTKWWHLPRTLLLWHWTSGFRGRIKWSASWTTGSVVFLIGWEPCAWVYVVWQFLTGRIKRKPRRGRFAVVGF
jgi:hypothetical protein